MNKYLNVLLLCIIVASCDVFASMPDNDDIKKEKLNPANGTSSLYIYNIIKHQNPEFTEHLNDKAFAYSYLGFLNLKAQGILPQESNIITLCDFTLSGNEKRLWIIDLKSKCVLAHSLVSHGKNTGEEFASSFSNKEGSHQSSLGFYITDTTYLGSNGFSLRLYGLDTGVNDLAANRAIVMHGADYCSETFIQEHGRLGRSWGCPSVPLDLHESIINTIKEKTLLYIYHAAQPELHQSKWLHKDNILAITAIDTELAQQ